MASIENKGVNWPDSDILKSTSDPNLSMTALAEEVPSLTVATIIGLIVVMLFAIAAVFVLGVLIDCRQQRVQEKKIGVAKRLKNHRRVNSAPEDDSINIANNMETSDMSLPPAEIISHIP